MPSWYTREELKVVEVVAGREIVLVPIEPDPIGREGAALIADGYELLELPITDCRELPKDEELRVGLVNDEPPPKDDLELPKDEPDDLEKDEPPPNDEEEDRLLPKEPPLWAINMHGMSMTMTMSIERSVFFMDLCLFESWCIRRLEKLDQLCLLGNTVVCDNVFIPQFDFVGNAVDLHEESAECIGDLHSSNVHEELEVLGLQKWIFKRDLNLFSPLLKSDCSREYIHILTQWVALLVSALTD